MGGMHQQVAESDRWAGGESIPRLGCPGYKISSLSREPDFVLLNSVPGADNADDACYLGDGPSDMISTMPGELAAIVGPAASCSADDLRALFEHSRVPAGVNADQAAQLEASIKSFWAGIDGCYEDDWDRPALPAERRWIAEEAVGRIVRA